MGARKPVKMLIFQNLEDNSTVVTFASGRRIARDRSQDRGSCGWNCGRRVRGQARAPLQLVRVSNDLSGDGSEIAGADRPNRQDGK